MTLSLSTRALDHRPQVCVSVTHIGAGSGSLVSPQAALFRSAGCSVLFQKCFLFPSRCLSMRGISLQCLVRLLE